MWSQVLVDTFKKTGCLHFSLPTLTLSFSLFKPNCSLDNKPELQGEAVCTAFCSMVLAKLLAKNQNRWSVVRVKHPGRSSSAEPQVTAAQSTLHGAEVPHRWAQSTPRITRINKTVGVIAVKYWGRLSGSHRQLNEGSVCSPVHRQLKEKKNWSKFKFPHSISGHTFTYHVATPCPWDSSQVISLRDIWSIWSVNWTIWPLCGPGVMFFILTLMTRLLSGDITLLWWHWVVARPLCP